MGSAFDRIGEPAVERPQPVTLVLSSRSISKVFFTVLALFALSYVVYLVRSVLLLVFIAGFLAVALGPAVDRLSRGPLPRAGAILVVYLGIVAVIVGVGLLVVPPIVDQIDNLASDVPGYLRDLRENDTFREYDDKYDLSQKLNEQAATLPSRLGDAAGALQSVTVGVFSAGVQLITVLTMTFFLLLDGRRLVEFIMTLFGPSTERRLRPLAEEIYTSTAGYVTGAVTIATIAGFSTFVVLELLGTTFAVPLAVLMFFLDLVPLIGATIAGAIIAIVTAFTDFPGELIIWAIFLLVYQQVENNVLQPMVYRRAVSVAPLLVIVSILIGSSLLGVLGALVAIPVAAAIQTVVRDFYRRGEILELPPDGDISADPPSAEDDEDSTAVASLEADEPMMTEEAAEAGEATGGSEAAREAEALAGLDAQTPMRAETPTKE